MTLAFPTFTAGMVLSMSLIMAIGPQNAHVLRMGLQRQHLWLTVAVCALADIVLISLGVLGLAQLGGLSDKLLGALIGAGVLFLGVAFCNGQPSVENMVIPVWLMLLCSVVMGVGTSVGGEKIIKSVGMDMVKLEKYQGFSADLSSSLCLLLATLTGIPVSTTHVKTTAIMGVGAVKRISAINFGVVKDMLLTWIFTFPGCGLISFCMAKLFLLFI